MLDAALTFLQIVKVGLDIVERFKPQRGTAAPPPAALGALQAELGRLPEVPAEAFTRDPQRMAQALATFAQALGDWQPGSSPLCPLLLRKAISFGFEEKNLGLLPAQPDPAWLQRTADEWKAWLERGPRNNEGLLVYLFDAPERATLDLLRALNQQRHSMYHVPRYAALDVRSGTFHGPPRSQLDTYLLGFGQDSFWNRIMDGVGLLVA